MQNNYNRFKPYQQPSSSCKSDRNNSHKLTGRVKIPNTYWTLSLERLPLRGRSSASAESSTAKSISPLVRLKPGIPTGVTSSERSVKHIDPLKDSTDERSDFLPLTNGPPVVPPVSEDSPSEILGSSMNSQHISRADGSFLSLSTNKHVDAPVPGRKDDIGRSPSRVSALQLTKSSRTPQFTPKQTKENREFVVICSSSDNSDDSLVSSGTSSSKSRGISSTATKAKKKMHIHRKSGRSKEVIVIDEPPKSRKRCRLSSSSDEFEDSRFLNKRSRCEDVIDLTALEDSPPVIVRNRAYSSSDPNRTPEFVRSSAQKMGFLPFKKPAKKSLFTPRESSDSDQTPLLNKSFGIADQKYMHDEGRGTEVGEKKGIVSDSHQSQCDSGTEKQTKSDRSGSIPVETSQDPITEPDEKLYEAMSESSFHSGASMNTESEDQTTVKGDRELVQGFTLDLNSEEDDDDVFVKDTTLTPIDFEPVSSPSASPEPEEEQTEKVSYVRVLSLVSECSTDFEEPVRGNAKSEEEQSLAKTSEESSKSLDGNLHINGGLTDVAKECEAALKSDIPVIDNNDSDDTLLEPHVESGGEGNRHLDNVGEANVKSTERVQSVTSAVQSVVSAFVSQHNQSRGSHTTEIEGNSLFASRMSERFSQHEIRSLLAARGIATNWTVEKQMHFITLTQENLIKSKLEDDTRLPSQRLCFVAQYLRIFTNRLRIPNAEILSRLWQLIYEPLVNGSGQLTDESVSMCMQYLRQLLMVHPPGQHQLVDEQYSSFLQQISNQTTSSTFGLWEHLEMLAKSPATIMMATFLIDLLLADLWAVVNSRKLSTALFVDLFWKNEARNHTRPVRRLMDAIDQAVAVLGNPPKLTVQISNLMALLNMAATECSDLTTELIVRWKKLSNLDQSFLVGHIYAASFRTQLIGFLPEVQKVHAAYRQLFSSKSGLFSSSVKSVYLVGGYSGDKDAACTEQLLTADLATSTTPLMCSKSVLVSKSATVASPTLISAQCLIKEAESSMHQRNALLPSNDSHMDQHSGKSTLEATSQFNGTGVSGVKDSLHLQNLQSNPDSKCPSGKLNNTDCIPETTSHCSQLNNSCQPKISSVDFGQKRILNRPVNKCNNNNICLNSTVSEKPRKSVETSDAQKLTTESMTLQSSSKIEKSLQKLKRAKQNSAEDHSEEQSPFPDTLSIASHENQGMQLQSKTESLSEAPKNTLNISGKTVTRPHASNMPKQNKRSPVTLSARKLWEQQYRQPKVRRQSEGINTNKNSSHHAVPTDPKASLNSKSSAQRPGVARRNSQPATSSSSKNKQQILAEHKGHGHSNNAQPITTCRPKQLELLKRASVSNSSDTSKLKFPSVVSQTSTSPIVPRESPSAVTQGDTSPLLAKSQASTSLLLSAVSQASSPLKSLKSLSAASQASSPLKSHGLQASSPLKSHGLQTTVLQASSPLKSHKLLSAVSQASSPLKSQGSLSTVLQASTSPLMCCGLLSTESQASTNPPQSSRSLSTVSQAGSALKQQSLSSVVHVTKVDNLHRPLCAVDSTVFATVLKTSSNTPLKAHNTALCTTRPQDSKESSILHRKRASTVLAASQANTTNPNKSAPVPSMSPSRTLQDPRKQKKKAKKSLDKQHKPKMLDKHHKPKMLCKSSSSNQQLNALPRRSSTHIPCHSSTIKDQQVRRKSEPLLKHAEIFSKKKIQPNPPPDTPQKPQTSHSIGSHPQNSILKKRKSSTHSTAEERTGCSLNSDSQVLSLPQSVQPMTSGKSRETFNWKPSHAKGKHNTKHNPNALSTPSTKTNTTVLAKSSTILHQYSNSKTLLDNFYTASSPLKPPKPQTTSP